MTIPWLEEERGVTEMELSRVASDDGVRWRRLLALIAIAEAAQELITDDTPDGPDEWRVYKAVQAAKEIQ